MPAHFVFVRFFVFYHDPFPFDRILTLKDDEVGPVLEKLRDEWLAVPENERELTRDRNEQRKRIEEWNRGAVARPGMNYVLPGGNAKRTRKEREPEPKPSTDEVFAIAGWASASSSAPFTHGISRRYPMALFESKDAADATCKALQFKADDIARAARGRGASKDADYFIATSNPRFYVIAEADLAPGEIFTVREKIERLCRPRKKNVSAEEAFLRLYLPELQRILELSRADDPAPKAPTAGVQAPHVPAETIGQPASDNADGKPAGNVEKKPKKSKQKGDAEAELIPALTAHHRYADGIGGLNSNPIGNNELARNARVDKASASAFFKKHFKGHAKYKATCRDPKALFDALKLLNGEYPPHELATAYNEAKALVNASQREH